MKNLIFVAMAGLLATVASAQSGSFQTWIHARYPDPSRVTVQTVLHDASIAGIAQTAVQQQALKQALLALQSKGRAGRTFLAVDSPAAMPFSDVGSDVINEHEFNDSWCYADQIIGSVVGGDCSKAGDIDSWGFTSTGSFYSIDVQAQGGLGGIIDSVLTLRNSKGDVIAVNDNFGSSLLSQINLFLPAGSYYADVSGFSGNTGGIYQLSLDTDNVAIHSLGNAGGAGLTQASNSNATHDVFEVQVAEGRLQLHVNSSFHDTQLKVQRADGVTIFANEDSSFGLDAAADIDLLAGTYFIYVNEVNGVADLPFTITYASIPQTFSDVIQTSLVSDSITGDESMRLVKIDLSASAGHVEMTTSGGAGLEVFDTVMVLLDRDLDFLCDVDDDNSNNLARGLYSRIAVSLPSSVYYAAVTGFPGSIGSYSLNTSSSAFSQAGTLAYGPANSPTTISGLGIVNTYSLANSTQTSASFVGSDYFFTFIGSDGQLASCQKGSTINSQAGEIPTGGGFLLVWDRYDYTGPLNIAISPALSFNGLTVLSHAKEGDLVFYLAEFGIEAGSPINFGFGDRGFLVLPMTEYLVTLDVGLANAEGIDTLWTPPSFPYQVMLQTLELHTGVNWVPPAVATWRNMIRL
jgi:hypothetical protein